MGGCGDMPPFLIEPFSRLGFWYGIGKCILINTNYRVVFGGRLVYKKVVITGGQFHMIHKTTLLKKEFGGIPHISAHAHVCFSPECRIEILNGGHPCFITDQQIE